MARAAIAKNARTNVAKMVSALTELASVTPDSAVTLATIRGARMIVVETVFAEPGVYASALTGITEKIAQRDHAQVGMAISRSNATVTVYAAMANATVLGSMMRHSPRNLGGKATIVALKRAQVEGIPATISW